MTQRTSSKGEELLASRKACRKILDDQQATIAAPGLRLGNRRGGRAGSTDGHGDLQRAMTGGKASEQRRLWEEGPTLKGS